MLENQLKELLKKSGLKPEFLTIDSHIKINDYNLTFYQTTGFEAQQDWMILRKLRNKTGLQPFIVIDEFYYSTKVRSEDIDKVINLSEKIDGKKWLQNRLDEEGTIEEIQNRLDNEYQKIIENMDERIDKTVLTDQNSSLETFRIPYSDDRVGYKEEITIFLFPAKKPWQVLAYLDIEENRDIYFYAKEEEHLAVMKYWYEKYTAEPAGLYCGELEFYVENPPNSYVDAKTLAFEHYAYCPDSLKTSNLGSIDLFTQLLTKSTVWYFGWQDLIVQ